MKRDIEFLFEIGALRFIPRSWQRFLGPNFANLSDHHYRVAWIALIIAAREGVGDTGKILKMALVHDIPESRTGDVDYLSRQYVTRDEAQGLEDMLEATAIHDEFVAIWHEYEQRECIEAKIVKDADNLDIDLELREQAANGNTLEKAKHQGREIVHDNKLYTQTAKDMFTAIKTADPHDWHVQSARNRFNGGDWKTPKA